MDFSNPKTKKFILVGVLSALAVYLYFFSTFLPVGHRQYSAERAELEGEFQRLSADLSKARQTLSNLEEVERQYEILTRRWDVASRLLPEEREVADLLRQVTLVGHQAGVEFELFRPGNPIAGEVYIEAPVSVKVTGGYHQVGTFLSEVANMERIVNVAGLRLEALDDESNPDDTMFATFTATAYSLNMNPPVPEAGGEEEEGE